MPSPLQHSSARVLEFETLRDILRGYAASPLGQARIAALAASTDQDWIRRQQQMAQEVREFRRVGGSFEFSGLVDPNQLVQKARIRGAALEPAELRDIISVVDRAAEWRGSALPPPNMNRVAPAP